MIFFLTSAQIVCTHSYLKKEVKYIVTVRILFCFPILMLLMKFIKLNTNKKQSIASRGVTK